MSSLFTNGYALLIGVTDSMVPRWALPDVGKDVKALAAVLKHPDRCAYPPDHLKAIVGSAATRKGILDGLEWLGERVQADPNSDSTVVTYFTGHGWRDEAAGSPSYYLIPYDIREDMLRSRALRAGDLAEAIREIRPRRLLVVLDCCHAAGMAIKDATAPAGFVPSALPPTALLPGEDAVGPEDGAKGWDQLRQGAGRAVLSSSQGNQASYIRRDGAMSIFTYHLIEALTGHARPAAGATEVLVSDIMGHVSRRVPQSARADCGEDQHPDYQISGNFPVALLLGGGGLGKDERVPDVLAPLPAGTPEAARSNAGGVTARRDVIVHGDMVGGDKITIGNIIGSTGVAVGRDASAIVSGAEAGQRFDHLFRPLMATLRTASVAGRDQALLAADGLEREVALGAAADDARMAALIRAIVDVVPDAAPVLAALFASAPLVAVAGPATAKMLKVLRSQ
jgi:hypothetical protein